MSDKFPKKVDKNISQTGEVSFKVRLMNAGYKVNKTFDSLVEAQIYRDLFKSDSALDIHEERIFKSRADKAESKAFKLSDAIKRYRDTKEGLASEECYRLNKLLRCEKIADMPLYQIKANHLQDLLEWVRVSNSPKMATGSTVKRYYSLLHTIFEIAVTNWNKIEYSPFLKFPKDAKPIENQPRDRRLQGDEYIKLFSHLEGQERLLFILALETSMRKGDAFKMRWENLDLKNRRLLLPKTKNGEARTIYLSLDAIEAIKSLTVQGIKGKIITISVDRLRRSWEKARAAVGSTNLRWHDLRHEAISSFFERGLGDIEAATMSGHKDMQMLKRYAHLKQAHILDKLDRKAV